MSAIGSLYHADLLFMAIDGVSVPFTNGCLPWFSVSFLLEGGARCFIIA